MHKPFPSFVATVLGSMILLALPAFASIGQRFPSEKKVVVDPVTGTALTFLTSKPAGDSKIYQTHHQWTSDGQWVVFRSKRVKGEAMAVNEETGDIVQVTEGGYTGMLCLAEHSMHLYFLRIPHAAAEDVSGGPAYPDAAAVSGKSGEAKPPSQIIRVDLAAVFADSAAGHMKPASEYQHVCGIVPPEYGAVGDVALDPSEKFAYFRVGSKEEAAKHLSPGTKIESDFGPRHMGAGPTGLASMNLENGEVKFIVAVPFQIGHVQTNPFVSGEIVFCWETGGKSPQRTWTVQADGTGLRPLYPEAPYDWVTHEAVITRDEVAFAIMGHRPVGINDGCGGHARACDGAWHRKSPQPRNAHRQPDSDGQRFLACERIGGWALGGWRRFFTKSLPHRSSHGRNGHVDDWPQDDGGRSSTSDLQRRRHGNRNRVGHAFGRQPHDEYLHCSRAEILARQNL
jgi:oligogalacturonide lyase